MTTSNAPRRANHAPLDLAAIHAKCTEEGDCWNWDGALHCGAPVARLGGKTYNVRRYMAEQLMGRNVAGKLAHTTCRNPRCVAPHHIEMITRLQLQRRTTIRTQHQQRASRNERIAMAARSRAALDPEKVEQIRASDMPSRALAAVLSVSQSTVLKARNYQSWKDYRGPFAGLAR